MTTVTTPMQPATPAPLDSKVSVLRLAVSQATALLDKATSERGAMQASLSEVEAKSKADLARAQVALSKAEEAFDADPAKKPDYLKAQATKSEVQRAPKADLERAQRLLSKADDAVASAQSALDAAHDALGAVLLSDEFRSAGEAPILEKLLAARRLLMQVWVDHRDLTAAINKAAQEHPRVLTEDDGEGNKRRRRVSLPSLLVLDMHAAKVLSDERHASTTPAGVRVAPDESVGFTHPFVAARQFATGKP